MTIDFVTFFRRLFTPRKKEFFPNKIEAFTFLCSLPYLPSSREPSKNGKPSKSEIRRWLESSSVLINNNFPKPKDFVEFPITQLIFFPKGKSRVTMV